MAFEAAFGVTAALFIIFVLLYVRSRKAKDNLVRSNIRLTYLGNTPMAAETCKLADHFPLSKCSAGPLIHPAS